MSEKYRAFPMITRLVFAVCIALTTQALAITWEDWCADKFTSTEQYDLSISGQLADPDHDGRSNLLEYAFETDPKMPDSSPYYGYDQDSEGNLRFSFLHRMDHPGIIYVPQITGN